MHTIFIIIVPFTMLKTLLILSLVFNILVAQGGISNLLPNLPTGTQSETRKEPKCSDSTGLACKFYIILFGHFFQFPSLQIIFAN